MRAVGRKDPTKRRSIRALVPTAEKAGRSFALEGPVMQWAVRTGYARAAYQRRDSRGSSRHRDGSDQGANSTIGDLTGGSRGPLDALGDAPLFEPLHERSVLASGGQKALDTFRRQIHGGVDAGKLTKGQIQMIRWVMKAIRLP
jgi:hypothetical protein